MTPQRVLSYDSSEGVCEHGFAGEGDQADGPVRDWERVAVDGFPFRELQPLVSGALLDNRVLDEHRLRLWVGYEHYQAAMLWCYTMTTRMMVTLDSEQHRRAKRRAAAAGMSLAEYIRRLVNEDLGDHERPRSDVHSMFDLFDSGGSDVARHKQDYVAEAVQDQHPTRGDPPG